jgi:starvation-inducible DNA-binding protein
MAEKKKVKDKNIIQEFGALAPVRIGLAEDVRSKSVRALNRLLAHTMAMRDAYKKAHWQYRAPPSTSCTCCSTSTTTEQVEIMDAIAERVQTLGGVTFALAQDVMPPNRISHRAARPRKRQRAAGAPAGRPRDHPARSPSAGARGRRSGDDGTNDLIVSQVVRSNELQSWFIVQHLSRHSELGDVQAPAPSI